MLEGEKSEEKSLLVKDPSKGDLKPECSSAEHGACRRHAELRARAHQGSGCVPCVSVGPLTALTTLHSSKLLTVG